MNSHTHALIDYWHWLPTTPSAARRQSLEHTCRQVRSGKLAPIALVPYALADIDEDVVHVAVVQYLDSRPTESHAREAAVEDALEWVRRGLALNRGAVFAALLGLGDPAINERLAPLRLTLSAGDVATVARRASLRSCGLGRRFLGDWLGLLAGEARQQERESLSSALAGTAVACAA